MPKKIFQTKKIIKEKKDKIDDQHKIQQVEKFYNSQLEQPHKINSRTVILSLLMAIIFGFLAGVLAMLVFLSGSFSNSRLLNWFNIESFLPAANVVIQKNESTTVMADERIEQINQSASSVVVGIYKYKKPSSNSSENFYTQNDFLGNGFILTNDGWIVTSNDVLTNNDKYVAITQNHKIMLVEQIKNDKALGLVYLKVKAENLPVAPLAKTEMVKLGQQVIVFSGIENVNKQLLVSRIASKNFQLNNKIFRNTENYYLFMHLDKTLNKSFWGTPVFNLNKEIVGLVMNYHGLEYVLPSNFLKKSLTQVLTLGKNRPTYLGLVYASETNLLANGFNNYGVLVRQIKPDSPLAHTDLKVGDRIIKLNDELLKGERNLTNLIQRYRPGDKITLTVVEKDNQVEKDIAVDLK